MLNKVIPSIFIYNSIFQLRFNEKGFRIFSIFFSYILNNAYSNTFLKFYQYLFSFLFKLVNFLLIIWFLLLLDDNFLVFKNLKEIITWFIFHLVFHFLRVLCPINFLLMLIFILLKSILLLIFIYWVLFKRFLLLASEAWLTSLNFILKKKWFFCVFLFILIIFQSSKRL